MRGAEVNKNRTGTKVVLFKEKQARALELRRQGYLLREIADALDIDSPATACNVIKKALKEVIREPAEAVIALELDRLDRMFVAAYSRASDQEKPFGRDAVETCLKIMERRAKLLGLDRPIKLANTDPTGTHEAYATVLVYLPDNSRRYGEVQTLPLNSPTQICVSGSPL